MTLKEHDLILLDENNTLGQGADPVSQLSRPQSYPEITCPPGVLTHLGSQAPRPTGETISCQRHPDQLTPDISRWPEANRRT